MRQLSAYIFDRRYSVPTLRLIAQVETGDERGLAQALLAESRFHEAVELCEGDAMVLRVERRLPATTGEAPPDHFPGSGASA